MKPGGGKAKGASFEREVCRDLSRWITGGKREDCFWRSAMSGGRATVAHRKGIDVRQGGDICSVSEEGHEFTNYWFVECKFVKSLSLDGFLLKGTGPITEFWRKAKEEALRHNREPMIIARQNGGVTIVITKTNALSDEFLLDPLIRCWGRRRGCDITLFSDLLKADYSK